MRRQEEDIIEETVYKATLNKEDNESVVLYLTNLMLADGGFYNGPIIYFEVVYPVSKYPQVKDLYSGITDKDFVIQGRYIPPMDEPLELEKLGTFKVLTPHQGEEYETYNNFRSNQLKW